MKLKDLVTVGMADGGVHRSSVNIMLAHDRFVGLEGKDGSTLVRTTEPVICTTHTSVD